MNTTTDFWKPAIDSAKSLKNENVKPVILVTINQRKTQSLLKGSDNVIGCVHKTVKSDY
jgi:hypothetical protein